MPDSKGLTCRCPPHQSKGGPIAYGRETRKRRERENTRGISEGVSVRQQGNVLYIGLVLRGSTISKRLYDWIACLYKTGNTTEKKTNEQTAISPHVSLERGLFGYFCELSSILLPVLRHGHSFAMIQIFSLLTWCFYFGLYSLSLQECDFRSHILELNHPLSNRTSNVIRIPTHEPLSSTTRLQII